MRTASSFRRLIWQGTTADLGIRFSACLCGVVLLSVSLPVTLHGDDDTLRDLGTNAVPGETAKWDGAAWRLAHDNVGVDAVVAGAGLSATSSNGTTTVRVTFGSAGTNDLVARHMEFDMTRPPIGGIMAWAKAFPNTPALPIGWVECNGQVLDDSASPYDGQSIPDLNGVGSSKRFLRGSSSSGATGGRETHGHSLPNNRNHPDYGSEIGAGSTSTENHLPPYYEVVWIMRVR